MPSSGYAWPPPSTARPAGCSSRTGTLPRPNAPRGGASSPSGRTPRCWPARRPRNSAKPGPARGPIPVAAKESSAMTASRNGDTQSIGVGLISVGWMGKLHTRAYEALPSVYPELGVRPRLVHAADTAPDRADFARDVLGYARAGADYRDVLADPEVDVVSICAPNMLHREIGIAAAQAGKPFWIEKPVGRDDDDTAAVAEAARAVGVTTSIGYNYRHVPAVERVRELIAAGRLGRVTNVRAVFFNSYAAEPNGALSWRFRREEAGSGALGDLLSHVVDLMQYVVAPITEVSSLLSTVYAQRPILPMGSGTHFAVIENGEMGDVE